MSSKFQLPKVIDTLIPLIITGMAIVLFIGFLFMFSYVLIWGIFIGALLWLGSIIKDFLFPSPEKTVIIKESKGRIIEHEDKKE